MDFSNVQAPQRRAFLGRCGLLTTALALGQPSVLVAEESSAKAAVEVSPLEDLMREHGLLDRILLIYDEARAQLRGGKKFPSEVLESAAQIVHRFVEGYHEKLEEDHLFPRFEKANTLVTLTETLRAQHKAGRILTDGILVLCAPGALKTEADRNRLAGHLREFVRMYRPHKAREDTVLFPAFHALVPPKEYDVMGDQFEDKEHELFGPEGFEKNVETVAKLEESLGINDLDRFTPQASRKRGHETI